MKPLDSTHSNTGQHFERGSECLSISQLLIKAFQCYERHCLTNNLWYKSTLSSLSHIVSFSCLLLLLPPPLLLLLLYSSFNQEKQTAHKSHLTLLKGLWVNHSSESINYSVTILVFTIECTLSFSLSLSLSPSLPLSLFSSGQEQFVLSANCS